MGVRRGPSTRLTTPMTSSERRTSESSGEYLASSVAPKTATSRTPRPSRRRNARARTNDHVPKRSLRIADGTCHGQENGIIIYCFQSDHVLFAQTHDNRGWENPAINAGGPPKIGSEFRTMRNDPTYRFSVSPAKH